MSSRLSQFLRTSQCFRHLYSLFSFFEGKSSHLQAPDVFITREMTLPEKCSSPNLIIQENQLWFRRETFEMHSIAQHNIAQLLKIFFMSSTMQLRVKLSLGSYFRNRRQFNQPVFGWLGRWGVSSCFRRSRLRLICSINLLGQR